MAVLSEYQRQGIGGMLIKAGSQQLRDAGYPFIVLVGTPNTTRVLVSNSPAGMDCVASGTCRTTC